MHDESLARVDLIREKLPDKYKNIDIFGYDMTTSTNALALEYARGEGACTDVAIFIADGQTAGRGRLGRSFLSPKGHGIYLSILTKVESGTSPVGVTTYAAVAAARVIEDLTGMTPSIKWVNDIYLGGRKVAGILTQGVTEPSGRLTHAVMGIGINVYGELVSEELASIATTIENEARISGTPVQLSRTEIVARLITEYLDNLGSVGTIELADEYRRRSFVIGKKVTVHTPNGTYPATVTGINDACELILLLDSGEEKTLGTGEVSIRL